MQLTRDAFVATVLMLLGIGLLMVLSASITSRPSASDQIYLSRHLVFLALAVAGGVTAAAMPPTFWKRIAPLAFLVTFGLLAIVLIPGVGTEVNGARRWLRYGPASLQPSELAKVTLPLFLCWVIDRRRNKFGQIVVAAPPLIPIALTVFLVLQEPDLGTSVFLCLISMICLFIAEWPLWQFVLAGGFAVPFAAGMVALKPYQLERINGFLASWSAFDQAPYQIQQSLTTLGVGGGSGVGLGRGVQKLSFLPEANTDFVFAVIGEELGIIGTLGLIALWTAFFLLGLKLLTRVQRRTFASAAAITLLTQLVLQAAINACVVTALLPPKGIPHPLVSYGGSSLVMSVLAIGIIVSLSRDDSTFALPSVEEVDDTLNRQ
ncbi:MAG: putative lipid II flippase FtsW [Planctomycetaceae bacterium]|nr:putative lipid II flippase FtsW [Planctomycetaceae bacterium]